MPHIIVEHSRWISSSFKMGALLDALHGEAMQIEALPVGGLRVRSSGRKKSRVGDGAPANQFIYIVVRIGKGRSDAVRKEIGDRLFKVLTDFTADHFAQNNPLSLGLEIQDIDPDWTWKKNNIHQIIKDKTERKNP